MATNDGGGTGRPPQLATVLSGQVRVLEEAIDDLEDNPSSAKTKLKLIIAVTEQSSSWRKKATQKLSEIGG